MELWNEIYFNIIDLFVISFITISCIVASYRGFIKEVFSMICWIAALVTSFHFYETIRIQFEDIINNKTFLETISFCLPFIITLFVSTLISKWLSPKFTLQGLLIFDKFISFSLLRKTGKAMKHVLIRAILVCSDAAIWGIFGGSEA